jgi:hypothetical protein
MAVVINEFEIVAEQPQPAAAGGEAQAPPALASSPSPQDIERILNRKMERCSRVRAH